MTVIFTTIIFHADFKQEDCSNYKLLLYTYYGGKQVQNLRVRSRTRTHMYERNGKQREDVDPSL